MNPWKARWYPPDGSVVDVGSANLELETFDPVVVTTQIGAEGWEMIGTELREGPLPEEGPVIEFGRTLYDRRWWFKRPINS